MIAPELIAFVAALGAGAFGALAGVGGGLIIVPILVALGVELHTAIGVSLLGVIAVSTSASVPYLRQGFANRRLGLTLLVATAAGGIGGGYVAGLLDARALSGLFALVLVLVAIQMLRARGRSPAEVVGEAGRLEVDSSYVEPTTGETITYRARNVRPALGVSVIAGAVSGLMGIGGGVVNVPTMNVLMGVPIRVATATSTFMLGATAAASAVLYLSRGQIDALLAAAVVSGVYVGAAAGARFSRRVSRQALSLAFIVIALIFAGQMAVRFANG
ncbi:MAG TPA: sulfite exporter TauE/SafE family protein [Candidatus Limnocylindrales bacterium]|nr:sulfite exporter TauE/SafE family protein [Candidatus Limnocylindrales bacterium]